jgi:hypothetical protein
VTGAVFVAAFLGIIAGSQQDGAIGAIVILAFTAAVVLGWRWLSAMQLQLTEVDVDIELDTQPRELTLPPDFSVILDREPAARRFFDSLSRSRQQALVLPVAQAKTPETRQRRIDKALMALREGRAQ